MPSGRRGIALAATASTSGRCSSRVAAHLAQRGPGEQLEAHVRAHRVAGQPEQRHAAQQPERERLRRLDRDLPPLQDAEPVEHRLHDVVVADRHAAARDHRVAGDQRVFERALDVRLVVARDAEVDRVAAGGRAASRAASDGSSRGSDRARARPDLRAARRRWRARRPAAAGSPRPRSSPRLAITPRCAGPEHRRPARTPAGRPRRRRPRRGGGRPPSAACATSTPSSPSRCVRSTITIASAPSGIGAPVMIRIASPGADRHRRRVPGRQVGHDLQPHRARPRTRRRCRRRAPRTRPSRCSRTAAPARSRRPAPRARARARRASGVGDGRRAP